MLNEMFASPHVRILLAYLHAPETLAAVVLPGILSVAILLGYASAGRVSRRLMAVWWAALPVSYLCAYWVITTETQTLYIFSAFSVACLFLLFFRKSLPPALAFALTFMSLLFVDMSHALARAMSGHFPIDRFYLGVGGAGWRDALIVVPLITAGMVAYARLRIRHRGERLVEI